MGSKDTVKKLFTVSEFSFILPSGWVEDTTNKNILALYRRKGGSGAIQISKLALQPRSIVYPEKILSDHLKNESVEIKSYKRGKNKFAITDFFSSDNRLLQMMVVINKETCAFVTYNGEAAQKSYMDDVHEIFDSFTLIA